MGVSESVEQLGQLVVLYGHNKKDFPWKDCEDHGEISVNGLIVKINDKQYVISVRSELIGCENIFMFHCYFIAPNIILCNDVHIIFQSADYNIVILGTKHCDHLDLSMSKIIFGQIKGDYICPFYNILSDNKYTIPITFTNYKTAKLSTKIINNVTHFYVNLFAVKSDGPETFNVTFADSTYMYKFIQKGKSVIPNNLNGCVIYNDNYKMVGMVTGSFDKEFYVLPLKTLQKVAILFSNFVEKPNTFLGSPVLFMKENNFVVMTPEGPYKFKNMDGLIAVNENNITIINDKLHIFDPDFRDAIRLEIFIFQNFPIRLTFKRGNKLQTIDVIGWKKEHIVIPVSDMPFFYPKQVIPHVNIRGIIVAQLTNELFSLVTDFDKLIEDENIDGGMLMIIDCLDNDVAKKYKLPRIKKGKQPKREVIFLFEVNGRRIKRLGKLRKIMRNRKVANGQIKLLYGQDLNDAEEIIFGANQYDKKKEFDAKEKEFDTKKIDAKANDAKKLHKYCQNSNDAKELIFNANFI